MGLSMLLLVVALTAGAVGGFAILKGRWFTGLVSAGIVLIAGECIAVFRHGLDLFGVIHWVYLAMTGTIPLLAAAAALQLRDRHPRLAAVALGAGAALVAVGLYSTHVAPYRLEVDRQTIVAPELSEPIRVVVLADIQNSRVTEYERGLVELIAAESPDLVLMAGDLWQMSPHEWPEHVQDFADLIEDIGRQWPLIMVDGDADWADGYDEIVARTENAALFLYDDVIEAEIRGQRLIIGGAARYTESWPRRTAMFQTLAAEDPNTLTILLAHRPEIVYEVTPFGPPDLVVAGHTHGGQVALPFVGPPITLTTVPRAAAAGGLSIVDGALLYVSTGIGLERHQAPQIRFGVRPSIGVLDLIPSE